PPAPAPPPPSPGEPPQQDYCFQVEIMNIPPDWLTPVAHNLSKEAYGLGLKSKIEYDFSDTPLSLKLRADGSQQACYAFEEHFTRLIDFVNSQPRQRIDEINQAREVLFECVARLLRSEEHTSQL